MKYTDDILMILIAYWTQLVNNTLGKLRYYCHIVMWTDYYKNFITQYKKFLEYIDVSSIYKMFKYIFLYFIANFINRNVTTQLFHSTDMKRNQ